MKNSAISFSSGRMQIKKLNAMKSSNRKHYLAIFEDFWVSALDLQDCLYKTCRPGCETDINDMGTLKKKWKRVLARSAKTLDLTVEGGTKACGHWAKKVAPNGKPHVSAYEIHSVTI